MYELSNSRPGYKFSHLSKLKHSNIPRIALPQNKLCYLEELELQHTNSTEKSHDEQETCKNGPFDVLPLSKVE
jgi:hypothetical protein